MAKTMSLKEHLEQTHEELKAAAQKNDAEIKTRIQASIHNAELAKADLKARVDAGNAKAKEQAEETRAHLSELAENGKKALHETGDALHKHLKEMTENAKRAMNAGEHL